MTDEAEAYAVESALVNANLNALKLRLREEWRIKWACDYAITCKYGEYHLLANHAFKATILEDARGLNIVFASVHVY